MFVFLVFFAASICAAASDKKKDLENANTNRQSLEASARGQERAELCHQLKEQGEPGKNAAADREKKKKSYKDKDDDGTDNYDSADDDKNRDDSDDKATTSSDGEQKSKKWKWLDFF